MRKISEILEIASQHHIAFVANKGNTNYMCHAISAAHRLGEISKKEKHIAKDFVYETLASIDQICPVTLHGSVVCAISRNKGCNNEQLNELDRLVFRHIKDIWQCIIWKLEEAGQ